MRRLTPLTKLCRNYLFANQDALDGQYASDIRKRLEFITSVGGQVLDALLEEDPDSESDAIQAYKEEVQYQLDQLDYFVEGFTSYCNENGLEIEKSEVLDALGLHFGEESELYIICEEWSVIAMHAEKDFITQLEAACPDDNISGFMREQLISCFMETYQIMDAAKNDTDLWITD